MAPQSPAETLLGRIFDALGGVPDRNGNFNVECPECGKGERHFAYSLKGAHCFHCGYSASLHSLAESLNVLTTRNTAPRVYLRPPPPPPPAAPPDRPWQRDPNFWKSYVPPSQSALHYYHQRGFTNDSIATYHLGYGPLPDTRCKHSRFVLPVFDFDQSPPRLVALKGRRVDGADKDHPSACQEAGHPKWLSAAGSKTVLFGAECLRKGATVVVTAAPYNVILAMQTYPGLVAVCPSQGEGTWRPDWTERIARSDPLGVVVYYDADPTGEKGVEKAAWALERAGVKVTRHKHPVGMPKGHDLADDILEGRFKITPAPDMRVNPSYLRPDSDRALALGGF